MLFHSSIRKELARSFGATLIVLATVVMTITLIRTLGQATRGNFDPADVMLVMGYAVLADMPTILTLSLFIAIIASVSRMYRDSEMAIWFASGIGLFGMLRPLLWFAWPVLLVVTVMALVVQPWSRQRIDDMQKQYESRGDVERLEPGQFQESASGDRVFFIEKDAGGKVAGSNVFIATTDKGKDTVTSARSGRIETVGQDRFLVLNSGQRLERTPGQPGLKVSEFAQYRVRVGESPPSAQEALTVHARSTLSLLQQRSRPDMAELSWRLGLVFAAVNLVLLGLGVSSVNPRAGRSGNTLFALFSFVLYFNLLNLGQSWISSGQVSFAGLMLGLHGGVLMLAAFWLARRHNNWRGFVPWQGRRTPVAGPQA
jgi:lipopolysaccharide export system permease protein